jgi:hypothetical protein
MHTDTPADPTMPAETATPAAATPAPATDPRRRYLCRHVFTDGHRCGSPSLRDQDLCYYHTRSRREGPCASRAGTFRLSGIDDRQAIQLALFDVLSRLSAGDIEYKRGSVLLYGLQIASTNLSRTSNIPLADRPPQVEEITSDYDLGDLAPIAEIPFTATAPAPATAPVMAKAPVTAKAPVQAREAVILSEAKNPCISTAQEPHPQPPSPNITPAAKEEPATPRQEAIKEERIRKEAVILSG